MAWSASHRQRNLQPTWFHYSFLILLSLLFEIDQTSGAWKYFLQGFHYQLNIRIVQFIALTKINSTIVWERIKSKWGEIRCFYFQLLLKEHLSGLLTMSKGLISLENGNKLVTVRMLITDPVFKNMCYVCELTYALCTHMFMSAHIYHMYYVMYYLICVCYIYMACLCVW